MIVEARVNTYISSYDVADASGDLNIAVAEALMIDPSNVTIDCWTFESNQEYDEADTPGTPINTMMVNGEGPAYADRTD